MDVNIKQTNRAEVLTQVEKQIFRLFEENSVCDTEAIGMCEIIKWEILNAED